MEELLIIGLVLLMILLIAGMGAAAIIHGDHTPIETDCPYDTNRKVRETFKRD